MHFNNEIRVMHFDNVLKSTDKRGMTHLLQIRKAGQEIELHKVYIKNHTTSLASFSVGVSMRYCNNSRE